MLRHQPKLNCIIFRTIRNLGQTLECATSIPASTSLCSPIRPNRKKIARLAARTFTRGVVGGIGCVRRIIFARPEKMEGTSSRFQRRWRRHKTKSRFRNGRPLHRRRRSCRITASMSILTLGAEPLFSSTISPSEKWIPLSLEKVLEGISRACHATGCALVGGETAQMPDFYEGRQNTISPDSSWAPSNAANFSARHRVKAGDALIALPSTGLHTNGIFSRQKINFRSGRLKAGNVRPPRFPATKSALNYCARINAISPP